MVRRWGVRLKLDHQIVRTKSGATNAFVTRDEWGVEATRGPCNQTVEGIDEGYESSSLTNVSPHQRLDGQPRMRSDQPLPFFQVEAASDPPALDQQHDLEEADRRYVHLVALLFGTSEDTRRPRTQSTSISAGEEHEGVGVRDIGHVTVAGCGAESPSSLVELRSPQAIAHPVDGSRQ
jgi:hypothetical protein